MSTDSALGAERAPLYSKVVVLVDSSSSGSSGLSLAESVARALGVPLRLLHVDTASPWRVANQPAERLLPGGSSGRLRTVEVIAARDVATGIEQFADHEPVLVVMSAPGRFGPTGIPPAGCESVLRNTDATVLLTGPRFDTSRHQDLKRIVVGIDGSEQSELILFDAAEWARRFDAEIELVTVVPDAVAAQSPDSAHQRRRLELLSIGLRERGCDATWQLLPAARTGHELARFAGSVEGSVIAISTHVRPTLAEALLGSVATYLTRHCATAVLINDRHD